MSTGCFRVGVDEEGRSSSGRVKFKKGLEEGTIWGWGREVNERAVVVEVRSGRKPKAESYY